MAVTANLHVFPLRREVLRRLGRAHAEQGQPMQPGLFERNDEQAVYEHAFLEFVRQRDFEEAECA